ncbi:hypothetical protein C8R47DRAFT_56888 [Mycena vitilis]|nr:hypothetical protein C8R47DRAFT_56888 [Mycena vitilis]
MIGLGVQTTESSLPASMIQLAFFLVSMPMHKLAHHAELHNGAASVYIFFPALHFFSQLDQYLNHAPRSNLRAGCSSTRHLTILCQYSKPIEGANNHPVSFVQSKVERKFQYKGIPTAFPRHGGRGWPLCLDTPPAQRLSLPTCCVRRPSWRRRDTTSASQVPECSVTATDSSRIVLTRSRLKNASIGTSHRKQCSLASSQSIVHQGRVALHHDMIRVRAEILAWVHTSTTHTK